MRIFVEGCRSRLPAYCSPDSWRRTERAIVLDGWNHAPRPRDRSRVDFRVDDPRRFAAVSEHLTPRIDHQRVPVALAISGMFAAHRRGDDETAVFYRAGAHQGMPVELARLALERGRYRDELCPRQREAAIQPRKTQVVAHRETQPAPRRI